MQPYLCCPAAAECRVQTGTSRRRPAFRAPRSALAPICRALSECSDSVGSCASAASLTSFLRKDVLQRYAGASCSRASCSRWTQKSEPFSNALKHFSSTSPAPWTAVHSKDPHYLAWAADIRWGFMQPRKLQPLDAEKSEPFSKALKRFSNTVGSCAGTSNQVSGSPAHSSDCQPSAAEIRWGFVQLRKLRRLNAEKSESSSEALLKRFSNTVGSMHLHALSRIAVLQRYAGASCNRASCSRWTQRSLSPSARRSSASPTPWAAVRGPATPLQTT